jgi:two-component system KDP operon response regulator KdpE
MPSPTLVLCIDDDPLMLRLVKAFLGRCGYDNILTACSGVDGLKMASLHPIDLVLLDYGMPDMNGAVVATGIRKLRPKALIIMLSGEDIPEQIKTLADAFVPKENFHRELVPVLTMLGAATQ